MKSLQLYLTKKQEIEEIEFIPLPEIMETNQEKLLKYTIDHLDTDVSPLDLATDELGCAESVSNLIKKVFPDFPIILGTADLFWKLKIDRRFKLVTTPIKGCIIVSPKVNQTYGHTGIFITEFRIASNNSKTGLFQGNYDWPNSWIATFGTGGRGLHSYIFSML